MVRVRGVRFKNIEVLRPFIFKFDYDGGWYYWRVIKLDHDSNILQYRIIDNKISNLSTCKWNDPNQICYLEK